MPGKSTLELFNKQINMCLRTHFECEHNNEHINGN